MLKTILITAAVSLAVSAGVVYASNRVDAVKKVIG